MIISVGTAWLQWSALHDQHGEDRLESDWEPPSHRAICLTCGEEVESISDPVRYHNSGNNNRARGGNELASLLRLCAFRLPGRN
jgi:hypothetical protein